MIAPPPEGSGLLAALDIGTGTGILALRAAQCGYRPVVALDNDPAAVEAAVGNVALNRMESGVHLLWGELPALRSDGRFGLILANLFLNPLLALAEEIARRLAANGLLIVSGIRVSDAPELEGAFGVLGLEPRQRREDGGWVALCLARSAR